MAGVAQALMLLGMALTVMVLVAGVVSMARGGAFNQRWAQRLMRMRLAAQGFAVLMFALGLWLRDG